ncbi:ATP synthase mitochondrial F1 complex assembly factor 2-like [Haliotis rufescens]|uniref:ATP synthase mitochondrial F1 complex assembly factor 2-like n=1 Tax=Haliotis rufescens TaxID=6454 RepID=UPI001EB02D3E|nr:ATP synthase mitochondrial F1 complex assembly factor 2-like [Haliotis rufescens]
MAAPMMTAIRAVVCRYLNNHISNQSLVLCRHQQRRCMQSLSEMKKFYKQATIATADGWYEINLDKRKLRTPTGNMFRVPSEPLALAVATEWNAQEKVIKRSTMHLNSLCNTALDNPMHRTREDLTESIIHFLETDTICYRLNDPPELMTFLEKDWDPVLDWARERYGITIEPTSSIMPPEVPAETKDIIRRHLMSYSDWALFGYYYAVDSIKSLLITMALVDRFITVERAVDLARLEQQYQTQRWGNVEWYHDMDILEMRTRMAAATLFVHWCCENSTIKQKAAIVR